ncbi:kelch domain-containing protein 4 [Melitaea cinxia]|uniref:kelch domain-containing protein 4 n=1 Tax=Melitaea cinxia TaxID=113334 RepID=UPI001E2733C3|nr:kelch domain-containing protein 4 [Melitaea cinxia]
MGKKKNKNKVSGAVKTAAKTEKKLANKLKKELANLGEEDIAKVIAEIEREEAKRTAAAEKVLPNPPTARAYASLTPHPTNNELILFGGEFHNGKQTEVYNDLLFYNAANGTWKQVKAPGAPPPRSAHQAVATPANKGELWVFGGEFTSPTETQFYHYKDLWRFSLTEKKWEKVIAPNGPSPRSGHRMVLLGRKLFVFGGYCDDGRECKYFDDLYTFCLDTREWSKLTPSGRGPTPRSACVMLPAGNDSLIIYGGFSRVREGRSERAVTHPDMFRLSARGTGWTWRTLGAGAARAGQAAAAPVCSARAYVFGGVADIEETEEELRGEMSDELKVLDLETCRWHPVLLRNASTETNEKTIQQATEQTEQTEKEEITVVTDEVFSMRLSTKAPPPGAQPAPPPGAQPAPGAVGGAGGRPGRGAGPFGRMSAALAAQRSQLYVYGGVLERDDKQFYLGDMYSLDLHKLNEWKTIIEQPTLPDWFGSDSEDETDSASETDGSEDSEVSGD